MKANELRIGNLVQHEFGKIRYGIVTQINDSAVRLKTKFSRLLVSYKDIEPIPLTEEWLIKLGSKSFLDFYLYDRFKLTYLSQYKYWYIQDTETNCYMTKIEFVHDWQNFIFVMNSEELKIIH